MKSDNPSPKKVQKESTRTPRKRAGSTTAKPEKSAAAGGTSLRSKLKSAKDGIVAAISAKADALKPKRKPRAAKTPPPIPPILLEGDQPPAPPVSGPGQRYALG